MKSRVLPLLACLIVSPVALAQKGPAPACSFTPEVLGKVLGQKFAAGVPEKGIVGDACTYQGGKVKLWVEAGVPAGPTPAQMRKMMKPPGTKWTPVAGDPDSALIEGQLKDVSPFPSVSYERKGHLVNVFLTGDFAGNAQAIADWNAKLLKLPRLP